MGEVSNSLSLSPRAMTEAPEFDFREYFTGHILASGWFSDRFGNPRRHFCGDFVGIQQGQHFVLDERLYFTDGINEQRVWKITLSDNGRFQAESDTLVGEATGWLAGDTLSMRYTMKVAIDTKQIWRLSMQDKMILQPDGSLHNITQVYKWGIRIGTVSTQYRHAEKN